MTELTGLFPRIGIVTVTYNSASVLSGFLDSLKEQTHANFILYAIDNASVDNTLESLRSWVDSRLIVIANSQNIGIAAANNQGIKAALDAGCEMVLLLNNDVVFGPELLSTLAQGLNVCSCDITAPLIYFYEPSNVIWSAGGVFESQWAYRSRHAGKYQKDDGQYRHPFEIEFGPGCCLLVRREVFQRTGLIDERYFVYAEDENFMYRALLADVKTFLIPDAKLWHKVSSLTGGPRSDFTLYYSSRGRTLFITKHFGAFRGAVWVSVYWIYYPLRYLFGKDSWHQISVRLKGILEGYRVGREA
jgi:GT2 family glycosyltransferase